MPRPILLTSLMTYSILHNFYNHTTLHNVHSRYIIVMWMIATNINETRPSTFAVKSTLKTKFHWNSSTNFGDETRGQTKILQTSIHDSKRVLYTMISKDIVNTQNYVWAESQTNHKIVPPVWRRVRIPPPQPCCGRRQRKGTRCLGV
jgi:hypothetical protein